MLQLSLLRIEYVLLTLNARALRFKILGNILSEASMFDCEN